MVVNSFEQEFIVNGVTFDEQDSPDVAIAPDGNFVVVWKSDAQDGDEGGIFAQVYNEFGRALTSDDIPVNTTTVEDQTEPVVAIAPDGSFVVVWASEIGDGDDKGIIAQRFSSNGNPIGSEFVVNTFTNFDQENPAIAMAEDGSFVVTWTSVGRDGSGDSIVAQRFGANGSPIDDEFLVNTTTLSDQENPDIAMTPTGEFVIVWESVNQDAPSSRGIFAQRFTAEGRAVGDELAINEVVTGQQETPAIAIDEAGNFVVVWESDGLDPGNSEIIGRRFDTDGRAIGGDFIVNESLTNDQTSPDIAMDGEGNFIVSWTNEGIGVTEDDIFYRQFDATADPLTGEVLVNTFTTNNQRFSAIAQNDLGNAIIVWESLGQDSGATGGSGVYGQQFKPRANIPAAPIRGTRAGERLSGSGLADFISGLGGADRLIGRGGNDELFGDGGRDILKGNADRDTLNGGGGSDRMSGGSDDDVLIGAGGQDTMRGNRGDDELFGGRGRDNLRGNGGDDRLEGNQGSDTLIGGGGSDIFVLEVAPGIDTIQDFRNGTDLFELDEGLTFLGLSFIRDGSDTLIRSGSSTLARVLDITPNQITSADFLS
ncbi:MAG: calcium-binding protein [Leptolyngbyaceae bacterium]|nr:calcium-binding protein [Leptolyngbyaceae bacterium]